MTQIIPCKYWEASHAIWKMYYFKSLHYLLKFIIIASWCVLSIVRICVITVNSQVRFILWCFPEGLKALINEFRKELMMCWIIKCQQQLLEETRTPQKDDMESFKFKQGTIFEIRLWSHTPTHPQQQKLTPEGDANGISNLFSTGSASELLLNWSLHSMHCFTLALQDDEYH